MFKIKKYITKLEGGFSNIEFLSMAGITAILMILEGFAWGAFPNDTLSFILIFGIPTFLFSVLVILGLRFLYPLKSNSKDSPFVNSFISWIIISTIVIILVLAELVHMLSKYSTI